MYQAQWLWLFLGLSMWCWTLAKESYHRNNNINQLPASGESDLQAQLAAISHRLDALHDRLDQLVRPSSDRDADRVLRDLQGVCDELYAGRTTRTSEAPSTTEDTRGESPTCPPSSASGQFRVTQVKKEETNTSYTLVLCYEGPAQPIVMDTSSPSSHQAQIQHPQFGVVTAQVDKLQNGPDQYNDLSLSFNVLDQFVSMRFLVAPNSPNETHLPNIRVTAESGSDMLYKAGDDIEIRFSVSTQDDQNMITFQQNYTSLSMKSTTEEHVIDQLPLVSDTEVPEDFDLPGEVKDIQKSETDSDGNKVSIIHIPYSADRTAGRVVFVLLTQMNCSEKCLVNYYITGTYVNFYPHGHSGPFPDHFVGFVKQKPRRRGKTEGQVHCDMGNFIQDCAIRCSVGGDHPTVNVSKVYSQGQSSPYRYIVYPPSDYYATTYMLFDKVTMEDAGVYICRARSGLSGPEITSTYTMTVKMVAHILHDPNITTLDDGSLMAVCTAQGIPTPNVTFGLLSDGSYEYSPLVFDEADYDIKPTQLDDTKVQATFRLRNWRTFDYEEVRDIYCFAWNIEGRFDARLLDIYDHYYAELNGF